MRKIFMVLCAVGALSACELLEPLEEDTDSSSSGSTSTASGTYNYSYSCPGTGTKVNAPIPNRLSASCKSAWEFYARTYACNDADRFAEAEQRRRPCP